MDIIHEFEIKASQEEVYGAFTTEKGINGWWSKSCIVPNEVGEVIKVNFTEHNVEMGFKIEELVPLKKAKWKGTENANPAFLNTFIEFEVIPSKDGVIFKFNHSNWDLQWKGKPNYEQSRETWKHFMNSFKSYLETGEGQPW